MTLKEKIQITLSKDTIPDHLYNDLLRHFVQQAVAQGAPVSKHSKFVNWQIACELAVSSH